MTYILAIGDHCYSSWSLRGWLLFARFGIKVSVREARLYSDEVSQLLASFGGAALVPAVIAKGENPAVFWDSLAIAETLAERHPDAGHWPQDQAARALARSLVAEMHAGFRPLRDECPMNLRHQWVGQTETVAVRKDLDRIEFLWSLARSQYGQGGPWLFGQYSAADAFFAPVASRIATYALRVSPDAQAYVDAHLSDPAFLEWRRAGLADDFIQPIYQRDLPIAAWPGPA